MMNGLSHMNYLIGNQSYKLVRSLTTYYLNNSSGPQWEECPKDILSNYDNKHSRRISKERDIDKVREGKGKEASAYLQRRNLTLNPVSSYIFKVSGSLESFLPSSVLCPQITLSVFELSVSFHPSPYPLDTPTIIGLEFMYDEGVNRSTESSTEEPGNVSDWPSGRGSQNIQFS